MVFSKKWLRNHLKFLLHFLIHIDVLKLCRKFDFNFLSYHFLKTPNFGKNPCTIAHAFFQKIAPKSPKNFYYIFLYILMYLSYVESLSQFRLQFFEL